jgi:thiamine pyrophosphokinase
VSQHPESALVLLGSDPVASDLLHDVEVPDLVIAADSGIDQAHRLGLLVDVAVGDFDSVTSEGLARAAAQGANLERHPGAKAETDMVLALDAASARGVRDVLVIGGDGGRIDHLLANALGLTAESYAHMRLRTIGPDGSRSYVVRTETTFGGEVGEYVSLLPMHGPAVGVRTQGLRYALAGDRLDAGTSRGVSNELSRTEASVSVTDGVLLVVLPGAAFAPSESPAPFSPPMKGGI